MKPLPWVLALLAAVIVAAVTIGPHLPMRYRGGEPWAFSQRLGGALKTIWVPLLMHTILTLFAGLIAFFIGSVRGDVSLPVKLLKSWWWLIAWVAFGGTCNHLARKLCDDDQDSESLADFMNRRLKAIERKLWTDS